MTSTPTPTRQRTPILEPGRTCWAVARTAEAGLLIDGEAYFRAFHDAACAARDSILLAGWQFDRTVRLLRGEHAGAGDDDTRLLPFLTRLCRRNPGLRIRILCWDYSPAYLFQREWFQDFVFNRAAPGQLEFVFDDRHAIGASHHQKFVIVDGALAFLGSMDLCNARWDRRAHAVECAERCDPYAEDVSGPYHEVQAYLTGPAVAHLQELFLARWKSANGAPFALPAPRDDLALRLRPTVRMPPADVGLSRTAGRTFVPDQPQIREIELLHVDAILAAERSIYLESQYFGARAIHEALLRRLHDRSRPPLEVVLVCPRAMHSFTERAAMGEAQDAMFRDVRAAGVRGGHAVGIYHVVSCDADPGKDTYIHSKVTIVDDRFLTVGSANMNNRSLGLDTELNVSWEARAGDEHDALVRAIRRARVTLLAEHAGLRRKSELRPLYAPGFVRELDLLAGRERSRLQHHPIPPAPLDAQPGPRATVLDPEAPFEAAMFERVSPSRREMLAAGVHRVRRRFGEWRRRRKQRRVARNRPAHIARRPNAIWATTVQALRRWLALPLVVAVLALVLWALVALVVWMV